ncbi:hypothetical protein [uncultured Phascolarctobacterium sp.]|nr:hypothetical protein [uncultured Phascolarctobacterium sp.]
MRKVRIVFCPDFQLGNSLLCGGKACPLFPDLCGLLVEDEEEFLLKKLEI